MTEILVLYYSRHGHVHEMAEQIARGILAVPNCNPRLRTVPSLETPVDSVPSSGPPYVTKEDLRQCECLRGNGLEGADGLRERDVHHGCSSQRGHASEAAVGHHPRRVHAEAGGQGPVVGDR